MVQFLNIRDWQVKADWLLISGQDDRQINEPIALKTRSSGINRRGVLRVNQKNLISGIIPAACTSRVASDCCESPGFERLWMSFTHIKLYLLQEKTWTFYWIHSSVTQAERKAWYYEFGLKVTNFFLIKKFYTSRNEQNF